MSISDGLLTQLDISEERLILHLTEDVREIFSTMIGLDNLLDSAVRTEPIIHLENSISSLVGLAGLYNGLVSIHMSSALAVRVTGCMLGTEVTENDHDVNDALGEIANMIAGSFKQQLSKGGLDTYLSTPSVVYGKKYEINLGNSLERTAVRFAVDDDWFLVAVAIKRGMQ